jgi:hypothetical protein
VAAPISTTDQSRVLFATVVVAFAGPLTNGIGLGAKLGLASLHLIAGATVILGLRRTALAAERC